MDDFSKSGPEFGPCRWATREGTRIYQFITNNLASFHLWRKKKLVKHQKFLKYYDHCCLQNFILNFMSSLTVPIVKNSHILAGIYFIFLKERPRPNSKALQGLQ